MADRIASDAPTVETLRARLTTAGGTSLPALRVPEDAALEPGDEVTLVLDGDGRHARVDPGSSGAVIRGAYDARSDLRTLRDGDGPVAPADVTNRLVAWARANDRESGDAVALDEVDPGHHYGVRVPGERAVYDLLDRPDEGLQGIARDLDG
jgi:hypothetical protein